MAATRGVAPMLAAALAIAAFAAIATSARAIGVCYGDLGNDIPSAGDVVALYKRNGISDMRIYSADRNKLDALRGSGIGLILDVGGADKVAELAGSASAAASWVNDNVKAYQDVNIKYIAVGNELTNTGAAASVLPAMQNVQDAVAAAGLSVKVSTSVRFDVVDNSSPPSNGVFRDPGVMSPIVDFLRSNGAPLLANVYPYFAYKGDQSIDLNFALFKPSSTTVSDNGLTYTNLFDAMVDAMRTAVEKAGGGGVVDVVVSESGWPSADGTGASMENAQTYNQNLINHAGNGTPKKPGQGLEVYVFAMFNENRKDGDPTEKKFGLFNGRDQSPVYQISFA